ncbi:MULTISPECIES: hypothetical protein [unclassified Roseitalea]|uniref:hypothetical protein n=1 Tax=unclassified Roseitalea TaxID=2639107 RepID=UPI00273D7E9D|nr:MULTISPECIES: hypothetical protein [unclassified Roseitalea]
MAAARLALLVAVLAPLVYYGVVYRGQLPDHRLIVGYNDLVLHAASFALVTCVALVGARGNRVRLGGLVALAAGIELAQILDAERTASLTDLGASLAGIGLGWLFALMLELAWRGLRPPRTWTTP